MIKVVGGLALGRLPLIGGVALEELGARYACAEAEDARRRCSDVPGLGVEVGAQAQAQARAGGDARTCLASAMAIPSATKPVEGSRALPLSSGPWSVEETHASATSITSP